MQNKPEVLAASFSEIETCQSIAKHAKATLVLVYQTGEIRPIVAGSYESRYACGEAISLTINNRNCDAEVLCDACAKEEGLKG